MSLQEIKENCLSCKACPLGGRGVVFSNMNEQASIMVIGQSPGKDEVREGEPFVGVSGKNFDEAIKEHVGLNRSFFYFSNVIRCLVPEKYLLTEQNFSACRVHLDREIKEVNPVLIVTLGSSAFESLTGMHGLMKHHGKFIISSRYMIPVLPLLHPSPLVMNNVETRDLFIKDLKKIREFISQNG
jgi:DNA polymerase